MLNRIITGHRGPHNTPWTPDHIEMLTRLWLAGESAGVITAKLGEGFTRNAVIGKVHRLCLACRGAPLRRIARPMASRATRGTPRIAHRNVSVKPRLALQPAPRALMVSLDVLPDGACHWPIGDPRCEGFGFCGAPATRNGQPYCAHHQYVGHRRCA